MTALEKVMSIPKQEQIDYSEIMKDAYQATQPTIKDQLQTDYVGIGYILSTFAIGSILVMIFANQILKKSLLQIPLQFLKKNT